MSQWIETSGPLAQAVCDALEQVVDPELGMNVVELGLVYRVCAESGKVEVDLTMTSPGCPVAESIVEDARAAIAQSVPEAGEVRIAIVWDPPWTPARMNDQARGFFGWSER